jgi:hypothetical protein
MAGTFLYANQAVKVYRTTNLSVTSATPTTVGWDAEAFDTNSLHDNVTNNSRLTAAIAGKYCVYNEAQWDTSATANYRYANLYKNGSVAGVFGVANPNAGIGAVVTSSLIIALAASDYLEIVVAQDTGAALNLLGGTEANSSFGMFYIGN